MHLQKGNILFLILIAVALFATLSYTITSSSRTSGSTVENEKEKLTQAENNSCEANVNMAKNRLTLINGCSEASISYEQPNGVNENPNNPSNTSCFVFHPDGGGIAPCGILYTSLINVGTITSAGDTNTIFASTGGVYYKCTSWSGDNCTALQFSFDGSTFTSTDDICVNNSTDYRSHLCSSACGNPAHTIPMPPPSIAVGTNYDLQPDFSLVPNVNACSLFIPNFECSCW